MTNIKFKNVTLRTQIRDENFYSLKKKLFLRKKPKILNIIDDISFELNDGTKLGIIGNNGDGKTTLLRLMSGIHKPSSGEITLDGKISSFIDLNIGTNTNFSGYDNILLKANMIGVTKKEINESIDKIIDFSGLEERVNTKLSTYSSGMISRLFFSMLLLIQSEILILDEIFEVGDANFKKKSIDLITKIYEKSNIFIFASHNMQLIEKLCNRVIIIDKGRIKFDGDVKEGVKLYNQSQNK